VSADAMLGYTATMLMQPSWSPPRPAEKPEIRRIVRRLRKATPQALRLVTLLLKELETAGRETVTGDVP
jgi:hypothetical protein